MGSGPVVRGRSLAVRGGPLRPHGGAGSPHRGRVPELTRPRAGPRRGTGRRTHRASGRGALLGQVAAGRGGQGRATRLWRSVRMMRTMPVIRVIPAIPAIRNGSGTGWKRRGRAGAGPGPRAAVASGHVSEGQRRPAASQRPAVSRPSAGRGREVDETGQHLLVTPRCAEGDLIALGALEVQMCGVFPGHANAAV